MRTVHLGLTYVTVDVLHNLVDKWIYRFALLVECSVLQYLPVPILSAERVLILRCWYPVNSLVMIISVHTFVLTRMSMSLIGKPKL